MAEIEKLKIRRGKERAKATKYIHELKSLFNTVHEDAQSAAQYELDYAIEVSENHLTKLKELEAQLTDAGVEEESAHIPDLYKAIGLGKRLLSRVREREQAASAVSSAF